MKYLYMRASTNETKQSLQRQEKFGRDNNIPESNWFKEFASGTNNDRIELNRLLSMVKKMTRYMQSIHQELLVV